MSVFGSLTIPPNFVPMYVASSAPTTPAAATTDMFQIYGSGTKTIKIYRIEIVYNVANSSGAFGSAPAYLIKRSAANSSGTSSSVTAVPLDSNFSAATAVIKVYTANPTLGTGTGNLAGVNVISSNPSVAVGYGATSSAQFKTIIFDANTYGQPILLRGTSEGACVNFNGVIPGGTSPTMSFSVYFGEY